LSQILQSVTALVVRLGMVRLQGDDALEKRDGASEVLRLIGARGLGVQLVRRRRARGGRGLGLEQITEHMCARYQFSNEPPPGPCVAHGIMLYSSGRRLRRGNSISYASQVVRYTRGC